MFGAGPLKEPRDAIRRMKRYGTRRVRRVDADLYQENSDAARKVYVFARSSIAFVLMQAARPPFRLPISSLGCRDFRSHFGGVARRLTGDDACRPCAELLASQFVWGLVRSRSNNELVRSDHAYWLAPDAFL